MTVGRWKYLNVLWEKGASERGRKVLPLTCAGHRALFWHQVRELRPYPETLPRCGLWVSVVAVAAELLPQQKRDKADPSASTGKDWGNFGGRLEGPHTHNTQMDILSGALGFWGGGSRLSWDSWPLCLFQPEPLWFQMFYKLGFRAIWPVKRCSPAFKM